MRELNGSKARWIIPAAALLSFSVFLAAWAGTREVQIVSEPIGGEVGTEQEKKEPPGGKNSSAEEGTVEKHGVDKMLEKIHWLGHDCFRIDADKVIYFDPFELGKDLVPADVIFITHGHADHCSPGDVKKIQKKETVIVTTPDCAGKFRGKIVTVKPGDSLTVEGFEVEVVAAYNTNKKFHPKEKGWVGFIVALEGQRIYHAGDTDVIPEMKSIKADIAMLPVSGTYVMTAEEAVEAAELIKPQVAIPMHYGSIVGDERDAEIFKQKCSVPVKILERE